MSALAHPFRRLPYALAASGLGVMVLLALAGGLIAPHDPVAIDIATRLKPPSAEHWLGTDQFGRDLFSRLLVGAGTSLRISFAAVALATVCGVILGAAAGYFRGLADRVISAVTEALLALPGILLALALIAVIGPSEGGVMLALGIAYTPNVARVVRGSVLSLRERPFVEASRGFGHPHLFVITRHILPNLTGVLTVLASGFLAQALLSESALSFLGLGAPPPYPSWGGILADGQAFMGDAPWLSVFPGLAIALTLLCVNLVGDALRDAFDPRGVRRP